jgi:hypothetical protein
MATATDLARDSRAWKLPPYVEHTDGGIRLRVKGGLLTKILAPAVGIVVMTVVMATATRDWRFYTWTAGGLLAVGLLVASPLLVLRWWRSRVIPLADIRLAARLELGTAVALTSLAFATAGMAALRDLTSSEMYVDGTLYHLLPFALIAPVIVMSSLAGWLLRLARRIDPETPLARMPHDQPSRSVGYAVDYGETGARFPNILPIALGAPTGAAAWLSVVLSNLSYDHVGTLNIVVMGAGMGLVPLVAGLAWWPWLRRALTSGVDARQVRAIGWTHILGGVGGALTAAAPLAIFALQDFSNVLPGILGVLLLSALLVVPGRLLVSFGNALREPPSTPTVPVKADKSSSKDVTGSV